jgi:phosphohistidine phosphatase
MRTLVIIRHGKAEASAPSDFERQLTDRGHDGAARSGQWLAAQGIEPDYALVSTAARAVQTWEEVAAGAGWDLTVAEYDDAMYTASTDAALDLIRATDDGIHTLVVVGHNPTVAYLVQLLDDGTGDEEAGNELALGFPTSAVAVLSYDGDWEHLDEAGAAVTGFHIGRA